MQRYIILYILLHRLYVQIVLVRRRSSCSAWSGVFPFVPQNSYSKHTSSNSTTKGSHLTYVLVAARNVGLLLLLLLLRHDMIRAIIRNAVHSCMRVLLYVEIRGQLISSPLLSSRPAWGGPGSGGAREGIISFCNNNNGHWAPIFHRTCKLASLHKNKDLAQSTTSTSTTAVYTS